MKLSVKVYTCHPSIQELRQEDCWDFKDQRGLQSDFKASLNCVSKTVSKRQKSPPHQLPQLPLQQQG